MESVILSSKSFQDQITSMESSINLLIDQVGDNEESIRTIINGDQEMIGDKVNKILDKVIMASKQMDSIHARINVIREAYRDLEQRVSLLEKNNV